MTKKVKSYGERRDFRRFQFVALFIAIVSFACTEQQPNVVLIICDDLNDSVEGFGGHPQAITPNMDRLAQRGIRFLNAHANAPICMPSRASLITGVYPHRSGEFGYRQNSRAPWRINEILRQAVTMPEHFAVNGYRVMAAGKITHQHIMDRDLWRNADGEIEYSISLDYGPWPYDGESPVPLAHPNLPFKGFFWGFGPLSDLPVFKRGQETVTGGWRNYVPGLEKEKIRKYFELIGHEPQFESDFSVFRYQDDEDRDLMNGERIAEWAVAQFNKAREPFFMSLGFAKPHTPWYAPKKYFDLFDLNTLQLPPYHPDDLDDCAPLLVEKTSPDDLGREVYDSYIAAGGETMWRKSLQAYLACVAFVDDQIGKVLDGLESGGLMENTVVILVSDNGYHLGEKNHLFKNTLWREATRIPMVVAAPGVSGGLSCEQPVSLIDLYPTMVDLCGLPDPKQSLDGFSLVPLLKNLSAERWQGSDAALSVVAAGDELGFYEAGDPGKQHYALSTERWRYILCADGSSELYDIGADPHEWRNLAGRPEVDSIEVELKNRLIKMSSVKSSMSAPSEACAIQSVQIRHR
jgi:iduronate 2-sulfatase